MAKRKLDPGSKELSDAFGELLRSEVERRKEEPLAFRVLHQHQKMLREARQAGTSVRKLTEFLVSVGVQTNADQVRAFCREVLKEAPRAKKSAVPTQKTSPLSKTASPGLKLDRANETSRSAAPKTVQAGKPGFRVARDEEL